jgi:hypothetical protein
LKLLFVYNANGGPFNTMADTVHKIASPSTYPCHLCALTHGRFSMKNEWKSFVRDLPVQALFLHRNEFLKQFSSPAELPVIFILNDGKIDILMSKKKIDNFKTLVDLKDTVMQTVQKYVQHHYPNT